MAERIIELTIGYDRLITADLFPVIPGSGSGVDASPPIESVEQLIATFALIIRGAVLLDPTMVACGVDVLTVDHRNRPPTQPAAPEANPDYF